MPQPYRNQSGDLQLVIPGLETEPERPAIERHSCRVCGKRWGLRNSSPSGPDYICLTCASDGYVAEVRADGTIRYAPYGKSPWP